MNFKITYGSTALIVRTPHSIMIAADSKQIISDGIRDIKQETVCKIKQKDDLIYALTGQSSINYPRINLDDVISSLVLQASSFNNKVKEIALFLKTPIMIMAMQIKNHATKRYTSLLKSHQFVSLVIGGFDGVKSKSAVLSFKIREKAGEIIIKQTIYFSVKATVACIGNTEAFEAMEANMDKFFKQHPTVEDLLLGLISLQSTITPEHVGMPADLAVFEKHGVSWMRKQI